MLEPPFADEGLAARFDLLARRRVDHVVVLGGDLLVQALGGVRQQVAMLVHCAALHRHAVPHRGDRGLVEPSDSTTIGAQCSPAEASLVRPGIERHAPDINTWSFFESQTI